MARGLVLLTKFVAFLRLVYTCRENDEVFMRYRRHFRFHIRQRLHGDEANDGTVVASCQLDGFLGVIAGCRTSFGSHVRQDNERSLIFVGETRLGDNLRRSLNDTLASQDTHVDDIGEVGGSECTAMVLLLYSIPNVDEFAVFEVHEVVLLGKRFQVFHSLNAEVVE